MKDGRNAPCACGSGRKYKQCCGKTLPAAGAEPSLAVQQNLVALFKAGLFPELEVQALALVRRWPLHGPSWNFVGVARLAQKKDAFEALEKAATLLPGDPTAQNNFGNALKERGLLKEAAARFAKAVALRPQHARAYLNLGAVLMDMGRLTESVEASRHALALNPDYLEAMTNLGTALSLLGRSSEAEPFFRRVLAAQPDDPGALSNLGASLSLAGRAGEASQLLRKAVSQDSRTVGAHIGLAVSLGDLGDMSAAEEILRQALTIKPDSLDVRTVLLFVLNYQTGKPPLALLEEARAYGALAAAQAEAFTTWSNPPDPERRLRVGFVSGDFCQHPVAQFMEHVLEDLVQNQAMRLELVAYYTRHYVDAMTERLKGHFSLWRHVAGTQDEALARQIRADGIDILIDLSGHTSHSRLPVFAWKPAPVQMTWLGYLATTGVEAIDYLLADSLVLPESLEGAFTEKILRLPRSYLCFSRPGDDAEVSPLPAATRQAVTFGSFNNLKKLNDDVLDLWARILASMPDSRLLLKARQLADPAVQARLKAFFAARGIAAERLELPGHVASGAHLATYGRVDIALDPFPYPGITTTVEALWMGVPVVTLAGASFMERQGVGLLTHVGLQDWIASDPEDYLARAVSHATDLRALAEIRIGLRDRVQASPFFDRKGFAQDFECSLRGAWHDWCRRQLAITV